MISRVNMQMPYRQMFRFFYGRISLTEDNCWYINKARTALVMVLRAAFPNGCAKVGVLAYNCPTVSQAVVESGCQVVYIDVDDHLLLDVDMLNGLNVDAIIVSHLFGMKNDTQKIREICPHALIIDDCAHGFGLKDLHGDFVVYSICKGKFPYCGEGGILKANPMYCVKNSKLIDEINNQYIMLKDESLTYEIHIFLNIIVRNILFVPLIYRITSIVKYLKWRYKIYKNNIDFDCTKSDSLVISSSDVIRYTKMGNGTKRVYSSMLQNVDCLVRNQQNNAECIKKALDGNDLVKDVFWGENAYMCIIRTSDPKKLSDWFSKREIETSTHFKPCICHDRSFGYKNKTCSKSEQLVKELLFVPTYAKGKYYKF